MCLYYCINTFVILYLRLSSNIDKTIQFYDQLPITELITPIYLCVPPILFLPMCPIYPLCECNSFQQSHPSNAVYPNHSMFFLHQHTLSCIEQDCLKFFIFFSGPQSVLSAKLMFLPLSQHFKKFRPPYVSKCIEILLSKIFNFRLQFDLPKY